MANEQSLSVDGNVIATAIFKPIEPECGSNKPCPPGYICQLIFNDNGGAGFGPGLTTSYKCVPITICDPRGKFLRCNGYVGIYADGNCGEYAVDNDTANGCYTPPPPCPDRGTFIRCDGTTGVYADGNCGEYRVENDTAANCACKPTYPGVFVRCDGTTGVYNNGCGLYTVSNDTVCKICDPKDTYLRCEGTTGVYADGNCGEYKIEKDAQQCCTKRGIFIRCDGSTGVYADGNCGEYTVEKDASRCPVPCDSIYPPILVRCEGNTGVYNDFCNETLIPNDKSCCQGPARGTFLRCNGTSGIYADGECGEYTVYNDTARCVTCVPEYPGTFIRCDGTTGIYNNKCNDYEVVNDPQCRICTPVNTFLRCEGLVGVYADGNCGEYTVANDSPRCYQPCIPSYPGNFIRCEDTTGIYNNGCEEYPVLSDSACIKIPLPSPSASPPLPSPSPTPRPSPTPITWRSCVDGNLNIGNAPSGYREFTYSGLGGGTCWEPITTVGFNPNLNEALVFTYQRGASQFPQPKTITAINPSYSITYRITLTTNPDIIVTPKSFVLSPRSNSDFIVNVTPTLLNALGDGNSTIQLSVNVEEI